jgi:hypothetical protein
MNRQIECLLRAGSVAALCLMAACGGSAVKDGTADKARAELNRLEADPQLADRAPQALKEAQAAVDAAEESHSDAALSAHLAYLADRKVQTARALAEARIAEDQLKALRPESSGP